VDAQGVGEEGEGPAGWPTWPLRFEADRLRESRPGATGTAVSNLSARESSEGWPASRRSRSHLIALVGLRLTSSKNRTNRPPSSQKGGHPQPVATGADLVLYHQPAADNKTCGSGWTRPATVTVSAAKCGARSGRVALQRPRRWAARRCLARRENQAHANLEAPLTAPYLMHVRCLASPTDRKNAALQGFCRAL